MGQPTKINVDTTDLIQNGSAIISLAGDYKTTATNLFGTISSLMSSWSGEAAEKYSEKFNEKEPKVKQLGDVVESIGLALNQGGASFQATEEELVQLMNSINGN